MAEQKELIVTGSTGVAHVTPIDDAVRNTNTGYIGDCVVFDVFSKFAVLSSTANNVRIGSGYGMMHGRYFRITEKDYVDCQIDNCAADLKRMDLIVARYEFNTSTGYESIKLQVIKGTEGADYVKPAANNPSEQNINAEAVNTYDFVLYEVYVDDAIHNIDHITPVFRILPDGGRLGEIEINFNTLIDRVDTFEENITEQFEDLQEQFSSIPSEVAKAASKSYVDGIKTELQTNFQNGVDLIKNAYESSIGTLSESTPQAIANGLGQIVNRGLAQDAGGVSEANDYIAFNHIPTGYYPPSSYGWAPEIRANKSNFGTAAVGHVLKGQTFTSEAGLKKVGTMAYYAGNNVQTIKPSGGTGVQNINLSDGFYDSINVDRTDVYNAGRNQGKADKRDIKISITHSTDAANPSYIVVGVSFYYGETYVGGVEFRDTYGTGVKWHEYNKKLSYNSGITNS